jgi:tetratricopeptide (TPR) repeat protein
MRLTWLLWVLVPLWVGATPFEEGVTAYQSERYADAYALFETAYTEQPSAQAAYNAGCAAYRQQRLGLALVWFRRALKWDPSHENAAANLALVRQRRTDRIEPLPPTPVQWLSARVIQWGKPDGWAWMASGCCLLLGLLALPPLRRNPTLTGWGVPLLLAGAVVALALGALAQQGQRQLEGGVLEAASAYVKAEPRSAATDLFIIHEGTDFNILTRTEGWWEIQLLDGRRGWLPAKGAQEI